MIKAIQLNSKEDVIRLNKVACKKDYNIEVSCGLATLDARSLLALFTLIGKSDINLVFGDHLSPVEVIRTIKQMKLATC